MSEIDQEAENVTASVFHLLRQRGKDARNWQRQAEEWRADGQRGELAALRAVLADLLTGAEQQSQSHVDVAVKCRAALAHE